MGSVNVIYTGEGIVVVSTSQTLYPSPGETKYLLEVASCQLEGCTPNMELILGPTLAVHLIS